MCARLRVSAVVSAVLLPIVVIVAYARARIEHGVPTDYRLFGPTGADILSGHWNLVYADPQNMGGPFQLVPFGIARLLDVQAVLPWTIFYTCAITLLVFVFCVLVPVSGRSGEVRWMFWVTFVVAGAAVVANFIPSAVYGGHPAEMMVPLLWIVAAGLAKDQRFATAGIVIGISAGFESWGILGAVLIFVAVKPRVVRAAISCILTIAVVYGPFAATGVFRLFGFHWHVSSGSAWGLLFPHLTSFPWSLRVVQALVATIAGFVVARLTRSTWYAIWLAPLAIVGARLLLDPLLFPQASQRRSRSGSGSLGRSPSSPSQYSSWSSWRSPRP
jgi:lipoprotein signal peptidase